MTELIDKSHFLALSQLNPREVCERTSCIFDQEAGCYIMPIWGVKYHVYPQSGRVECAEDQALLHEYFSLFAVHYLLTAQKTVTAGQWISEKDMPGGATFFRGPHAIPTQHITSKAANSLDLFQQLYQRHQGLPLNMADSAAVIQITDRIPVAVLYWLGDDDFPAETKLLFDKTLPQHFALDIVFALAVGICEVLAND